MSEALIGSLITGCVTLIGVVINNIFGNRKISSQIENQLDKQQAVIQTKIENLTEEVKEHNNFAKRMPVLEEKISVINHRIDDLEKKVG